jgi:hypothetical protein
MEPGQRLVGAARRLESASRAGMAGGPSVSFADELLRAPGIDPKQLTEPQRKVLGALREATQQFEQIYLNMMFQAMRQSVPKSEFLHGGFGEDTFQEMMDDNIAGSVSRQEAGMGIGQKLYESFARQTYSSANYNIERFLPRFEFTG